MQDPYDILGIPRGASLQEAKQAYRTLARSCHPDVTGDPASTEMFCRVTQAYEQVCEMCGSTAQTVRVVYVRPRPEPAVAPMQGSSARRPEPESWFASWRRRRQKRRDSVEQELDELIKIMIKLSR